MMYRLTRAPRRSVRGLGANLRFRHEALEARLPLTADLAFASSLGDQAITEGDTVDVSFSFTDSVTTTPGTTIGITPDASDSLGLFDPNDPSATIVFDTDALTVTGFADMGTTASTDVGDGLYDIAVFTFDDFDLDAGQTITATGSRPFAILSLSDLTVGGVIDVGAQGRLAGPGGGDGGEATAAQPTAGSSAAGANPTRFGGAGEAERINNTLSWAGGGGGFGGAGGGSNIDTGIQGGSANGDLSVGIQGGGGGGGGRFNNLLVYEGGGGGGGVELGALGTIVIEASGSVLADGADGEPSGVVESGAGGAGGGILLHAFDVTVAGTLSAEGGVASNITDFSQSGGGGGGRILLVHDQNGLLDTAGSTISVAGGQSGNLGNGTSFGENGEDGDIAVQQTVSQSSQDNYVYTVELLDGLGGFLETLIAAAPVTDIVLNMAGDGLTGSVALTGLTSALFADDADLQVRVNVTDDQTTPNSIVDTAEQTVNNADPGDLALGAVAAIDENGVASIDLSFTDVGLVDAHTVTVDWGDGTIDNVVLTIGDRAASLTHQYLDDNPTGTAVDDYTITVAVADDDTGSIGDATSVTVSNLAPVLTSLATDSSVIFEGTAQGETVNLNALFTDAGTLDTHTAAIDWGDGTHETVAAAAGTISGSHIYSEGGFYDVTVTLTDDDTGETSELTQTVISGVGVQDGVLIGIGTNGDDKFKLFSCYGHYAVLSQLDSGGYTWRTFEGPIEGIDLLLGGGDDTGFVSSWISTNAFIDGGAGDDLIIGGRGDDILLGGAGYDLMFGRGGRDLLFGGTGGDLVFGDGGQDILVSGTTAYDGDREALDLILAEWSSERSYAERVDNLMGDLDMSMDGLNDEVFLIAEGENQTVFDDESTDWLLGGRGKDLYFAGDHDISFARFNEIVEAIEAEAPAS